MNKSPFKIGYRTIKTAIGATLSILLAQSIGLQFPTTAAVLTILCIQVTKKRSIANAMSRLAACLIGIVLGFICFNLLGFHWFSLLVLILILIPVLVQFKIQEGVSTSMVILLQLYTYHSYSIGHLVNELWIIAIGIGMALLLNLYMPSREPELQRHQQEIERNFKIIFVELAHYLKNQNHIWDGGELLITEDLLKRATEHAIMDNENQLLKTNKWYFHYFMMRQKQFDLLVRMVSLLSKLTSIVSQSEIIAEFLLDLSERIEPVNNTQILLDKLQQMNDAFRETALPITREEFEIRATLFYFLREMKQYLLIKREFYLMKLNEEKQPKSFLRL